MKKFFGALISVLMMAQAAFVPAFAQETAITAEADQAEVVLVMDEAQINGSTIEIPLYVESSVVYNSLACRVESYDEDLLTFVGFGSSGEVFDQNFFGDGAYDVAKRAVACAYMTSNAYSGKLCNLIFEGDPAGLASIEMRFIIKNGSAVLDTAVLGNHVPQLPAVTEAPIPDVPPVVPEEPEETSVSREEAEVIFTFSDVMCAPGDVISVDLSIESFVKSNSVALSNLTYDETRLEFLGFDNYGPVLSQSMFGDMGIDHEQNTIVLACMTSTELNGAICSLKFKVKDDAGYGMSKVSMDAIVKDTATDIAVFVDSAVIAPGMVEFDLAEYTDNEDGTISVPLYVDSEIPVNSIALYNLEYDAELLTFIGYSDYSDLVTNSMFGEYGLDTEKQTISLGYSTSRPISGHICNLVFAVNEGVTYGASLIEMSSIAKDNSDVIYSSVNTTLAILGDIDLDIGTGKGIAGGYVEIPVMIDNATIPANYVYLDSLTYDTKALTLEGCYRNGKKLTENNGLYTFDFDGKTVPSGTLCTLKFKVNESAAGGLYEVNANASVAKDSYWLVIDIEEGCAAIGETKVEFGCAEGKSGDIVYLDMLVNSEAPIDALYVEFALDASISFAGAESAVEVLEVDLEDSGKLGLVFVFTSAQRVNGEIAKLGFKINEDAEDGIVVVDVTETIASLSGFEFVSSAAAGSINIENRLLGDLDGDAAVDIRDVLLLFRHAMLPTMYPVDYPGTLDFISDGELNILDTLRLFQYTMLPGMYPIGW